MIFTKFSDLYRRVIEDVRTSHPKWIYILTYGLWAGVSPSGHVTERSQTFRFFNYLNTTSHVKVLIGYETILPKVCVSTAEYFSNISFYAVPKMHSKAIVLSTGQIAIGSSNINDSWWGEVIYYGVLGERDFNDVVSHCHQQEINGTPVGDVVDVDISELLAKVK